MVPTFPHPKSYYAILPIDMHEGGSNTTNDYSTKLLKHEFFASNGVLMTWSFENTCSII